MTSTPDYSPSWEHENSDDDDTPSAAWSALTDYDNGKKKRKKRNYLMISHSDTYGSKRSPLRPSPTTPPLKL